MKNIHLLPTDKPSRLYFNNDLLILDIIEDVTYVNETKNQNIYITNDEEIKDGDWMIRDNENPIKVTKDFFWDFGIRYFKIILTTDPDLIKDGVQAIDDEFLEWFVKNPSCEFVEINTLVHEHHFSFDKHRNTYKIIIPKEEPKQFCENCKIEITKYGCGCGTEKLKQETLEEVAERYYEENIDQSNIPREHYEIEIKDLMIGFAYKWQQQQNKNLYSEQTVTEYAYYFESCYAQRPMQTPLKPSEWFEQFKKK